MNAPHAVDRRALRPHAGFTLIELMVTVAIVVIAMAIAVPSMKTFQRNAELTAATNTLTAAINAARGEAMKRNLNAFVVPAQSGQSWSSGYRVFVEIDRTSGTGVFDADTDLTVSKLEGIPSTLEMSGTGTASGATPYIMFDGSGYTRDKDAGFPSLALTIRRIDTRGSADEYPQTRHVMITRTGRTHTCKPASASDANCDPSSP